MFLKLLFEFFEVTILDGNQRFPFRVSWRRTTSIFVIILKLHHTLKGE